jgi:hypothetical protein
MGIAASGLLAYVSFDGLRQANNPNEPIESVIAAFILFVVSVGVAAGLLAVAVRRIVKRT